MVSLVAPLVLNLNLALNLNLNLALNLALVLCGAAAPALNLKLRRTASPHIQRTIVNAPWKSFPSERLST